MKTCRLLSAAGLFLALAFSFLSVSFAVAADKAIVETKNKAKPELLSLFSSLPLAVGDFNQRKYFKVLKQPIKSSGQIYFDQQLGFLWQTRQPVFSALMLKQSGLYVDDGINPEQKVAGAAELSKVLISAISGDIAALNSGFDIVHDVVATCLILTPKQTGLAKVVAKIKLCGSGEEKTSSGAGMKLKQLVLMEVSGNRTEIDLNLNAIEQLPGNVRAKLQ